MLIPPLAAYHFLKSEKFGVFINSFHSEWKVKVEQPGYSEVLSNSLLIFG